MEGHIRKRGPGRWAVVLYLGRDPATGKEKRRWYTVRGTRRDAERLRAKLVHEFYLGTYVEPTRITLREFLTRFLEGIRPSVAPSTYSVYEMVVRRYMLPSLGPVLLARLTPDAIQKMINRLVEEGGPDGKPLSPATALKTLSVLHRALEQAVRWGLIGRNPCKLVDRPKIPRTEMQVWDEEQVRLFLAEAKRTSRYYPLYLAAVTTGMRQGELLGLRWKDVDLASGVARISQIYYRGSFREPKSQRSRRTVVLPEVLVRELVELKRRQEEEKRIIGEDYNRLDLVFVQSNGKPVHVRNMIRRDFEPIMRRAGVPKIRFHDLRHTHATYLLKRGVHPKIVSERLGHSRIGTTMDIYSHVFPEMQREATRQVDRLLGGREQEDNAQPL